MCLNTLFAETCPSQIVSNGQVTYNSDPVNGRYLIGVVAVLSCASGYHLYGRNTGVCQFDGTFDAIDSSGCTDCNNNNNIIYFRLVTLFRTSRILRQRWLRR